MRPARILRMVDLPQPDGPSSATTSFAAIARLTPSTTRKGFPFGSVNSCETSRASQSAPFVCWSFMSPIPSFAQRVTLLGEAIAAAPDRSVERDYDCGHHQDARGQ